MHTLTRAVLRTLHTSRPHLARARGGVLVRAEDLLALTTAAAAPAATPATTPAPPDSDGGYLGATFTNGQWHTTVELNGKRARLGPFGSAKEASDAYVAATAVLGPPRPRKRRLRAASEGQGDATAAPLASAGAAAAVAAPAAVLPTTEPSARFRGVQRDLTPGGAQLYEAIFRTPEGREVSGGEYEGEEEAARAHDALCRMYLGEAAAAEACNFPVDPYTAWVPPEEVLHTGQVATLPGVPLTLEEIMGALQQERAVDARAVPLAGRSDLAEHLVFATGRSVVHMRRMADCVARAQRKRALPSEHGSVAVEGRDMDDWMVVDCGNIIVNIMDAEARECFDLERFYEGMVLGQDPYAGLSYEEWLVKNPVPEKWLARLERDEREMEEAQRTSGKRRGGMGYSAALAGGAVAPPGGDAGEAGGGASHHFTKSLRTGRPGRKTRSDR